MPSPWNPPPNPTPPLRAMPKEPPPTRPKPPLVCPNPPLLLENDSPPMRAGPRDPPPIGPGEAKDRGIKLPRASEKVGARPPRVSPSGARTGPRASPPKAWSRKEWCARTVSGLTARPMTTLDGAARGPRLNPAVLRIPPGAAALSPRLAERTGPLVPGRPVRELPCGLTAESNRPLPLTSVP
jgi:hypothetical protein